IPLWEHLNLTVSVLLQVAHGVVLLALTALLVVMPAGPLPREILGGLVIALILLIPYRWVMFLQPLVLLVLAYLILSHEMTAKPVPFALHLLAFYLTARLCHGALARDRPGPGYLTEYYVWVAAGGLVGGIFNVLVAPLLFVYGLAEYGLALVLGCMARPPA